MNQESSTGSEARNDVGLAELQAIALAPMWLIYKWNVRPWFKATPREVANKANAIGLMAAIVGISMWDLWLVSTGQGAYALPKSRTEFGLGFVAIMIVLLVALPMRKFLRFIERVDGLPPLKRAVAIGFGMSIYGGLVVHLAFGHS
jgi:hypothetical protein